MLANEGPFHVLVVDDEELYCKAIGRELVRQGMTCELAFSGCEAVEAAGTGRFDAVLLDHRLPDDDGIRLIPVLLGRQPSAVLFMMTAYEALQSAIQAIRLGAEDYLVKETRIAPIVEAVCEVRRRKSSDSAVLADPEAGDGAGLLGTSPAILRVCEQIRRVARRRETVVLFLGETGSGKEVAARALHARSGSAGCAFVAVDCTALPATLTESLLFGHEKGAFTGAAAQRKGRFELARGGTLFLDELGDIPPGVQVKLLNVLQTGRFERVGGTQPTETDARVIAATHRNLEERIATGAFRADLFYRLNVVTLRLPALRERPEDLPALVARMVARHADLSAVGVAGASDEALAVLSRHPFPGNVRELENLVDRKSVV